MAQGSQDAKFCIFHIRGASTFTAVPGQTSTTIGGPTTVADATNKDAIDILGVATKITKNVQFETNILESTELELIRTAWDAGGTVAGKALIDETPNFYYSSAWVVANFTETADDGDIIKVSVELVPKAATAQTT